MKNSISIVIPAYRGESSLPELINEIAHLFNEQISPGGNRYFIEEILIVHDCGKDRTDIVIENLASQYDLIKPVWLTKNFGQHAATIAGMANSSGDWVITIDEDGQHNPNEIGNMLDVAVQGNYQLVYGQPINSPPHGLFRNGLSIIAKKLAVRLLGLNYQSGVFNSYRMIDGEVSRILAAYCGEGVYLDIALFWITERIGFCPVTLRNEMRDSSYSFSALFIHFWKMVINSGTKPLRLITLLGVLSLIVALIFFVYALYGKFIDKSIVAGWTSLLVVMSFFSGVIMVSLGIVAEYLAQTTGILMGKPLYVISSKPTRNKSKK